MSARTDVWADPAVDGPVWFSAQRSGHLGRLDPKTGKVNLIPLGSGSSPHGVIAGADGAPWLTDSGQNAIVRVDPKTLQVKAWPLPEARGSVNLNTAIFDRAGIHWFTGQNGIYGRLDPVTGDMKVFDAPKGRGAYGIHVTPEGVVYYASLAGSRHRAHRRGELGGDRDRAAHQGPGRAARLVGLEGEHLGQRMELGPGQPL